MSKGSKQRSTDLEKYWENYDRVFKRGKRKKLLIDMIRNDEELGLYEEAVMEEEDKKAI